MSEGIVKRLQAALAAALAAAGSAGLKMGCRRAGVRRTAGLQCRERWSLFQVLERGWAVSVATNVTVSAATKVVLWSSMSIAVTSSVSRRCFQPKALQGAERTLRRCAFSLIPMGVLVAAVLLLQAWSRLPNQSRGWRRRMAGEMAATLLLRRRGALGVVGWRLSVTAKDGMQLAQARISNVWKVG
jgi:hypothetical protein